MDTKDIISKLKFIGEIKQNHKINVKQIQLQPNNMVTSFIRTFISSDNRQNTITFLQDTINKYFRLLFYLNLNIK